MSEHPDHNPRWVLIEPNVVAQVEGEDVTGLLVYGEISSQRLRKVNLARLDRLSWAIAANWDHVPAADEVATASVGPYVAERTVREDGTVLWDGGWITPEEIPAFIRRQCEPLHGETVEDWYFRFATMLKQIAFHVDSPNQAVADALDLPPNTVKQYVHRCRKLGFLPPSRRSTR